MSNPIEIAIQVKGSMHALALALDVKPPTVSEWRKNLRPIPPKRCVQIEQTTNGQVTRRDLRPDDWHEIWPELANPSHEA